jgi:outer membrane protein TolC
MRRLLAIAGLAAATLLAGARGAWADAPPERTVSLSEAMAIARENAASVRAAANRVVQADARVSLANAPRVPTLGASAEATAFDSNGPFAQQGIVVPDRQAAAWADATLTASWTFFDFGRTSNAVDAAESGRRAAEVDKRATELTAMAVAAAAYYTLVSDDEMIRMAEDSLAQRQRALDVTSNLARAGVRSPIDLRRAQIALDAARSEATAARAAADDDAIALSAALALPPSRQRLRVSRPPEAAVNDDPDVARQSAANRPEVVAERWRVEQARLHLASARNARLPSLGVQASGSARTTYLVEANITGSANSVLGWGGLQLTVPLLDATNNANVRLAETGLATAQTELGAREAAIEYEAQRASTALRSARDLVARASEQAAAANANLASIEEQYKLGLLGTLELVDAQREDAAGRAIVVRAQRGLDLARVRLLSATGRIEALTSQ